jgi:alpha-N-arabinofuranosidase
LHRSQNRNQITKTLHARILIVIFVILAGIRNSYGQANLPIYTDHLVNGFQNWSWALVNPANTSPVYAGSDSISVTDGANYQALYLEHTPFNTSPYASLDFWINGGASGGQKLQVVGLLNGNNMFGYPLALETNVWQHVSIPLSDLGVADATNCTGFWIQSAEYSAQPVYYLDDIQLVAAPPPAPVHLYVDAGNVIRTADTRWFGLNTAIWDGDFDTAANSNALKESGCTTLRYPGGSLSDVYNWTTGNSLGHDNAWATSFADFMHLATNLGAQVFITADYGTGTSNEAAAWVASANLTNHCNFKYWEIGNEVYGKWEADSNSLPHDPITYATRAAGYIAAMKAIDPTIKIGAVAVPGEDNNINYPAEAVTNPVTGQTHSGWAPVMLATFKNLGIYPDFLIYHYYPEYTSAGSNSTDSDPLLLQVAGNHCSSTFSDWASAAANLRMQITDYLGAPGTNIELCVTENEGDSGAQGKQSTSIVSALYEADSLCQLMQTEFNSLVWWDLRNGPDTGGDFDSTLYGWRTFGDYGIVHGTKTVFPAYYAQKLLQYFVRGGDSIVSASSDYLLLSDYAARRTNGALTLLVINKDLTTSFNAQIALTNFLPWSNATIQSYGIAQDMAAKANAPAPLQDIAEITFTGATTNFNYSFLPGTLTLFTFTPVAMKLQASLASVNVTNLVSHPNNSGASFGGLKEM